MRLPPMARPFRYEFYGVVYRITGLDNVRIEIADICTRVREGVMRQSGRSLKLAIDITSTSNVIRWLMSDMKALAIFSGPSFPLAVPRMPVSLNLPTWLFF